ncbi:MAG: monovalent cation/H+ antiporter subunit D family protein, partial [Nitrospiraceae bacterium]
EHGWWPVAAVVLIGSLLAVIYIWRVIEAAYFRPWPKDKAAVQEAPLSMLIPTWALIGLTIYFGFDTSLSIGVAGQAADYLLGTTP